MNQRQVFVVYNDTRKNLTAAERFGKLKDVFSSVGRVYHGDKLIEHARRVLKDWQPGDYLLMVGDPTLCAICLAVVLEYDEEVNVLRWDRTNFDYVPLPLNFSFVENAI